MSDFYLYGEKEFFETLDTYAAVSSKSFSDSINKKMRDLAYRAAQFTPKNTKTRIYRDLEKDKHLLAALTSIRLHGRILPSPEFAQEMEALKLMRGASADYLRVGWLPCIKAFGGTFKGGENAKLTGKYHNTVHSYGLPATPENLFAEIAWVTDQPNSQKANSAEVVAYDAASNAIQFVTADMEEYITRKLAEVFE